MKKEIPNILSWARIILSIFFIWCLVLDHTWSIIVATILFTIAALTDYFDGYYARKLNADSAFGRFFDPLADKVLTTAAFIAFTIMDVIPLWMVVIVLIRDFGTTFLRVYFDKKNLSFQTSFSAKAKTLVQMVFISYLLVLMLGIKLIPFFPKLSDVCAYLLHSQSVYISMFMIVILSVWTLIEYIIPLFKKNIPLDGESKDD